MFGASNQEISGFVSLFLTLPVFWDPVVRPASPPWKPGFPVPPHTLTSRLFIDLTCIVSDWDPLGCSVSLQENVSAEPWTGRTGKPFEFTSASHPDRSFLTTVESHAGQGWTLDVLCTTWTCLAGMASCALSPKCAPGYDPLKHPRPALLQSSATQELWTGREPCARKFVAPLSRPSGVE